MKSSIYKKLLTTSVWALLAVFAAVSVAAQAYRPQLVSASAGNSGATANNESVSAVTNADGRLIAFQSSATNLVQNLSDANNAPDVFLLDARTNQIRCLSLASGGNQTASGGSFDPVMTPDGRYVIFGSSAGNLVAGDTNGLMDVFRVDTLSGEIRLVSTAFPAGDNGGNGGSPIYQGEYKAYDVSDNGRFIAFTSLATNLTILGDSNNTGDVFVRDMESLTARAVSFSNGSTSMGNGRSFDVNISADGNLVSFLSNASDLLTGINDLNGAGADVFVRNMQTSELRCATLSRQFANSTAANGHTGAAFMSRNGTRVAFYNISTDLTPGDTNIFRDIYVYDIGIRAVSLVTVSSSGSTSGNAETGEPQFDDQLSLSISADGRYVVFESRATNLVEGVGDTTTSDIFRRDLTRGITEMVSIGQNGLSAGSSHSRIGKKGGSISRDGRFVTFLSLSNNLLAESMSGFPGVFVRDMNLGTTFGLSLTRTGNNLGSNSTNARPEISGNGKSVAFQSFAADLATTDTNGTTDVFRSRVPVPQQTASDFDGDGKTDYAVWRPSNGHWYVLPNTGTYVSAVLPWGASGDRIAPVDFSGDGRADFAVWRPASGVWYIIDSSNFNTVSVPFGQNGDEPVPADYDGDGKADIAVFRAGVWHRIDSATGQYVVTQFGLAGDKPIVADFDGDAKADPAVYREGVWFVRQSSNGQTAIYNFGLSGDRIVPADYDGDGRSDIAVWRSGVFHILESRTGGYKVFNWGLASDLPLVGDYDGDGRSDAAVFRPSSGTWYVLQSMSSSFQAIRWGQDGDAPAVSAFVR